MARTARQFPQGKFTLRTPKQTKNGQMYAIYIYYYWQGRQLRRSADLLVHKNDWNQSANNGVGELRASYGVDFQQRNAYLQRMLRSIDSQIMQYVEKHGDITSQSIFSTVSHLPMSGMRQSSRPQAFTYSLTRYLSASMGH